MRSDNVKKGIHKAAHRSLLYATGVSKEGLKRPFIGIASSFSDLVPGHAGMRDLERQIEKESTQAEDRHLSSVHLPYATVLQWGIAE